MAVFAVVDEAGFERRFDAGDHRFVDIGFMQLTCIGFNIDINQFLSVDNSNPQLFLLGCIEQHTFHKYTLRGTRPYIFSAEQVSATSECTHPAIMADGASCEMDALLSTDGR